MSQNNETKYKILTGQNRFERLGRFEVWYSQTDAFTNMICGHSYLVARGLLPIPGQLFRTHEFLGAVNTCSLEMTWNLMQGENWSPKGEARGVISAIGLSHTSMSVGDIIKDRKTRQWWFCDLTGWKELDSSPAATAG